MKDVVLLVNAGDIVKRGLSVAIVMVSLLGAGCTGAARPVSTVVSHHGPRHVLFGFDSYVDRSADVEGSRLVRLDPVTLRELMFSSLKLSDVTTGHVFSPNRKSMAFGTLNDRQVVVADLVDYQVAARFTVALPPPPDSGWPPEVSVVSWPRADRLLAYSEPIAAHQAYPARLVVIDPAGNRVLRTAPLGGSVVATAALPGDRTGFLVASVGRDAPAKLVIVEPDGGSRTVTLPETASGQGVAPAIAVVGTDVYVVGNSNRIAQIDAGSGRVRYHAVPGLLSERLPDGPPLEPGSGGIMSTDERDAVSLGGGLLGVGGYQVRPARHGTENQNTLISEQIVDTKTWTVRRTLHRATRIVAADGLYYCWVGSSLFGSPVLVAMHPDGAVAFRRTNPNTDWEISAGRLFETRGNAGYVELDPLTGRVLRRVAIPADVYPIDLVPWTAPS